MRPGACEWKPVPGFSSYEASLDSAWRLDGDTFVLVSGGVRSIDRDLPDGRHRKGQLIKPRPSKNGYLLINMTDDDGVKRTCTLHSVVLAAHAGECPAGQESRHWDDNPLNNRWRPGATEAESVAAGGNLFYGTKRDQYDDKIRNGMAVPVPPPRPRKPCILCGLPVDKGGRRCHACVVGLGEQAAEMLSAGVPLGEVMKALDYPSAEGLHTLAVKYGGYAQRPAPSPSRWHRVTATLRDRLKIRSW
jgi:hypothetical protein